MKTPPATPRRRTSPAWRNPWLLLFALVAILIPAGTAAAQAPAFSQIRSLYVEPFTGSNQAAALRDSFIHRLKKSGKYQIADSPQGADAIVTGSGQIWVRGHFTVNSRAPAANRQTVYGGFLSAEILSKDHEPLWSYLVTPSKFSWLGIQDDLASNLVKQLLLARDNNVPPGAVPGPRAVLGATNLNAAGATFPQPLYQKWFESFEQTQPGVHLNYSAVGSEEGLHMLDEGKVDFAASDVPALSAARTEAGPPYRRIASVMGAVVPIYNLSENLQDLNFTGEILAGIYLGRITKWNDPAIVKANRDANLPNADILVFHRSDGSGTTHAWSDFLSKTSPEWKSAVGTDTTLKWPAGTGVVGNEGVADAVEKTPNSIGYVELVYAIRHQLSYGDVRNSAGNYIHADVYTVAEAAKSAVTSNPDSLISITDPSGKDAYPIATFTWLLFPQEIKDGAKKAALLALLRWILTAGQSECSALAYTPLPRSVAAQELDLLNTFH